MNFEDLTPEQRAKALACKTPEELLALAKEEGYDLTDEQLESISGGWGTCNNYESDPCPAYVCRADNWC